MDIRDVLKKAVGDQSIDPNMPTGAYAAINPFTGSKIEGGWYLDGGVCPYYEEYNYELMDTRREGGTEPEVG